MSPHGQAERPPPGGRLELAQVAVEHDSAVVDEHDGLADVLDQVELVAGEDHGPPAGRLGRDDGRELLDGQGVEPAERLVEDQQIGVVDQGGGQLHPLLHAPREPLELLIDPVTELQLAQQPVHPFAGVVLGQVPQPAEVDELVPDPHLEVEAPLLGHVAPAGAVGPTGRLAPPPDLAVVDRHDPEHDPHHGGLARSVGSQQADDPARGNGEPDPVEYRASAELHRHPVELEGATGCSTPWFVPHLRRG
jgi:hypothetical protein